MPVRKWGSEKVVGTTDGELGVREADVAGLADGGYVVVWEDASDTQRVLAQRFDAQGSPVGTEIVVGSGISGEHSGPQVAALANGGFAISFTSSTGGNNLWVREYSAGGIFQTEQGFATNPVSESQGAITSSGTGHRLVFQFGDDILGAGIVNSDALAGTQLAPSIAEIADGDRFVVTWLDTTGGNYRYRVFEADGTAVTASTQVNNPPGVVESFDIPAAVTGLANGGFVIAWDEMSATLQDQDGYSVHAKIYNANGVQVSTEFVVNATFKHHQGVPDVVALPDGGFVAVWSDSSSGVNATDHNIAGQVFNAFGQRVGGQFTVNTGTDGPGSQISPHVAALEDGRLVVQWHSVATGEIRTQIVDPRDGLVTGSDDAETLYGHTLVADEINGLGGGDALNGMGGDDALYGGDGTDVLRGGTGADYLDGGAGTDTASWYTGATGVVVSLVTGLGSGGEAQDDTLSGIENLSGSQGSDSLVGDTDANTLQGWNGNDVLTGSGGKDTLTGGIGGDRFQFTAIGDSMVGANADRITDFSHAQGDRIDLAGIDARFTVAGDQAFSFIGTAAFTGVAGQLHYWHDAGRTIVSGDVNGNGTADFNVTLTGTIGLVAGDFVL
ncbi:Ca2+-binding RTX toxin-like protein [Inquilinus ginsengisoli]|uniref:calcium-binding protein n=1 Tax=Inquilinus ginsengisoli TaxID=363840 RepID=UPI003D1B8331